MKIFNRIKENISGVVQKRGDSRVVILTNEQLDFIKRTLLADSVEGSTELLEETLTALDRELINPLKHLTNDQLVALASERLDKT